MDFIVVTEETVTGRYRVEADTPEQAKEKFEANPRCEGEQLSYEAFSVKVEKVEPDAPAPSAATAKEYRDAFERTSLRGTL